MEGSMIDSGKKSPRAAHNEFWKCRSTLVCFSMITQNNEQRCYGLGTFYESLRVTKINSNSLQDPQEKRLLNVNAPQDREVLY